VNKSTRQNLAEARRPDDEISGEARLQSLVGMTDVTAADLASRVVAEAARWAGSNAPPRATTSRSLHLRRTGEQDQTTRS